MSPRKRLYSRHGASRLRRAIDLRGLDLRTNVSKALVKWRDALAKDLGGDARLTTAQRTLIEEAMYTKLFLDHLNEWLALQPFESLVHGKGVIPPALHERGRMADRVVRILTQLGVKADAQPPGPTLEDLRRESAEDEATET